MRATYRFIILLITASLALSQTTAIPDANFEQKLIEFGHDDVLDGYVLTSNISGITEIFLASSFIADLTGIESFTALIELVVSYNQLTALDVSANTALIDLDVSYNSLTALDVTANTALIELAVHSNQLMALDVTANTALKDLSVGINQLSTLDVSANTALTGLYVNSNQLMTLDVSANTSLTTLWLHNNQLSTLDVSENTALNRLLVHENPDLTCIYIGDNAIANFTLSSWQFLSPVPCQNLSAIDNQVIPDVFSLHQNYPNPFNPITSMRYDLPNDGLVNITIYDMMGRIVKTLVNGSQTAGFKSVQWNATNDKNEPVSVGLYLYSIQAGEFRQTKKMVLLK